MAYGEQSVARKRVAYTVSVWPAPELIAQSWSWPECWRAAYRDMAWAISLAAATQVLEGGTFAHSEIGLDTGIGRVKFTISQIGPSVRVRISEFFGPDAPGPDDDGVEAQPHAIGGLVIGLRGGVNRCFHVVIFHGEASSIPSINRIRSNKILYSGSRDQSDILSVLSELQNLAAATPESSASAWGRALLREIEGYLGRTPAVRFDSPVHDLCPSHPGETTAMCEGIGISGARLPAAGRSSEITHAIYFDMAAMENAYRTNSPYGQNTRQRDFKPRLH